MAGLEARIHQLVPDERQLLDARAEQVDALGAGDLRVEAELFATWPSTISFSGVISPPGTRGTIEYVPFFCRLARKWSLVSCSGACFGFSIIRSSTRQNRRHRRLADVAAAALAVFGDDRSNVFRLPMRMR